MGDLRRITSTGRVLAAIAAAVGLLLLALWGAGHDPLLIAATAWRGACGSWSRLAITATEAVPLALCGLGAALALRTGTLNIGLEGQCLLGMAAAVAVILACPPGAPGCVLGLAAGAGAGAAWCGLAVALERGRGVPLVLSTILLNTVAALAVGALVQGPLQAPGTVAPETATIAEASRLAILVPGTPLHVGALLVVAAALVSWLVQERTPFGFELTVAGLNPEAARFAGIPVERRALAAALGSGALAGLAGAVQIAGVTWFLGDGARSYGYTGIAVALLARLHPLGVLAAALFFAGLDVGARQLERRLDIPHDFGVVAQGLAVAAVLLAGALAARRRP